MNPDDEEEAPRPTRRRYTDDEQAAALALLAANKGNVYATADLTGIPETTLRQWANGERRMTPTQLSEVKESLAERFQGLAAKLLDVVDANMTDLDGKSAMIAAAVAVDKMLLLRGEATSITESRDDTRADRLRELYAKRVVPITDATTTQPEAPKPLEPGGTAEVPENKGD